MKLLRKCIISLIILTFAGCDGAFTDAVEAFRKPVNALPQVSMHITGGMIPSGTTLSGSASDADNDTLSYSWSEVTSFGLTFTNQSSPATEVLFTGNDNRDVVANAVIRLTVSDGEDSVSKENSAQVYRTDILYKTVDGTGNGNAPDNPSSEDFNYLLSYAQSNNKKGMAVAAGSYTVTHPASHIILVDGVDLYGGYDPSNWKRDLADNITNITDDSTDSGTLQSAIYIGDNVDGDIEVNGLTVTAGKRTINANSTAAIRINATSGGTVTVTRCTITSQDDNTYQLHGIWIENANTQIIQNFINIKSVTESSPGDNASSHGISKHRSGSCLITNNTIFGGSSTVTIGGSARNYGIFINDTNSDPVIIRNNCINAGLSNGVAYGIAVWNTPSTVYIQNNTIYAAASSYANGIYTQISSIYINNNIILMHEKTAPGTIVPVFEATPDISPYSIDNNNLFVIKETSPPPFYYHDNNGSGYITDFITPLTSPVGSLRDFGNLNEDLLTYDFFESFGGDDEDPNTMEDNNWRIRKNSNTVNILYGGKDLSQFTDGSNPDYIPFSSDMDGNERTAVGGSIASNNNAAGWSIGAYETD